MFYPITRSQKNCIVSATKVVIETQIVKKLYYNYPKRIIKRNIIGVHYIMETMSKLIMTSINFQKEGFH